MLSFRSNKSAMSHRSNNSLSKQDLKETSADKEKGRLKSKADPTMAINEAEPCMSSRTVIHSFLIPPPLPCTRRNANVWKASVASNHLTNLGSLRTIQHRDHQGNLIGPLARRHT